MNICLENHHLSLQLISIPSILVKDKLKENESICLELKRMIWGCDVDTPFFIIMKIF